MKLNDVFSFRGGAWRKNFTFKKLKRLCTARSTRLFSQVVLYVIELGQGMEINWSKLIIVLLETPTAVWNYRISCPLLFTVPLAGIFFFLSFFQAYVFTFLFVIFSATYIIKYIPYSDAEFK